MFMGEAANGALFSMQSSYVTVGNYPGIEARLFGSEGAVQVRLVEEFGVIQTIHTAKPDAVVQQDIPSRYFPPGYQDGPTTGAQRSTATWYTTSAARSSPRARSTRATSRRAPACRRLSTR